MAAGCIAENKTDTGFELSLIMWTNKKNICENLSKSKKSEYKILAVLNCLYFTGIMSFVIFYQYAIQSFALVITARYGKSCVGVWVNEAVISLLARKNHVWKFIFFERKILHLNYLVKKSGLIFRGRDSFCHSRSTICKQPYFFRRFSDTWKTGDSLIYCMAKHSPAAAGYNINYREHLLPGTDIRGL